MNHTWFPLSVKFYKGKSNDWLAELMNLPDTIPNHLKKFWAKFKRPWHQYQHNLQTPNCNQHMLLQLKNQVLKFKDYQHSQVKLISGEPETSDPSLFTVADLNMFHIAMKGKPCLTAILIKWTPKKNLVDLAPYAILHLV